MTNPDQLGWAWHGVGALAVSLRTTVTRRPRSAAAAAAFQRTPCPLPPSLAGQGYIILTHGIAGAGHRDMYIFRLTPDFLKFDSATSTGPLPGPNLVEAPAFFKRRGTYYALLGGCSCMGLYGGGVAVLTAKHPLGPCESCSTTLTRERAVPLPPGRQTPPSVLPCRCAWCWCRAQGRTPRQASTLAAP